MDKKETVQQKTHKIRITLTSLDVPKIEKVSAELVKNAKDKSLDVFGPKRMPTKIMRITTRRTPCGEGIITRPSLPPLATSFAFCSYVFQSTFFTF